MDFITGLPKFAGYECILVVVDWLSKYGQFIPLKDPFTAKLVAELFVQQIVRLHSLPAFIVNDRDPIFLSNFWRELFQLSSTKLQLSTAYHPEGGQTKVLNCCLETYVRCFASEQPRKWSQWLARAEFSYNTGFHSATCMTPFEAVYSQCPPSILQYLPLETRVETVAHPLLDKDEILRQLHFNLTWAELCMVKTANAHWRFGIPQITSHTSNISSQ